MLIVKRNATRDYRDFVAMLDFMGRSPAHSPIRVTVISLQRLSREKPLPLCGGDQERRSGVSPLCVGTGATERRSGVSPLCAGTIREEGLTMEVDKSRAALTSGETPLPLCGGEAELTSRAALTSGETPLPLCSRAPPAPIFARWPLDFFHRFLIKLRLI